MKMFKTIFMFILLFTGSVFNTLNVSATDSMTDTVTSHAGKGSSGRSLPTLVVAGVSIALVLLFILIVAIFWYGWKKSQEGSIEINPIPYGDPGVSLRTVSVSEN